MNKKIAYTLSSISLLAGALGIFVSCGKSSSGSGSNIPLVEPPVTAATPTSLKASSFAGVHIQAVTISELKSRFFNEGPTQLSGLLKTIDTRLAEINTRSASISAPCLSATPVEQSISVYGETVTAYFQCYDIFSGETGGMMFGKKDSTWYLYTNEGQGRALAKATLVSGTTDKYEVEAWMSVGQANATSSDCSSTWYGCSYGVIHLLANSSTNALELTTAGTGLGFCAAHLKTDGTNLYLKGQDGGLNLGGGAWTCATESTLCVQTSDLATAGTCTDLDATHLSLTSLGVSGQTTFGNNVTIDGATTDSVHFGPSVTEMQAISGVDKFAASTTAVSRR